MPTGFTEDLCKKDIPFEHFVLNCARACVGSMRDSSGPLPKRFSPSSYYKEEIRKDEAKLAALKAMSAGEIQAAAKKDHRKALKAYERHVAEVKVLRDRLITMRFKVATWEPPSQDHDGLKKFMIQQLDNIIENDGQVLDAPPKKKSGKDWKAEKIVCLENEITYNQEAQRKEIQQAKRDTLWVERLRDSLEAPAPDRTMKG
jgi:hypothetical protein